MLDGPTSDGAYDDLLGSVVGLRQLIAASPELLIAVDRDLRIQFLSRSPSGAAAGDAVQGRSVLEFVQPAHHERVGEAVGAVFRTGEVATYEAEALDRDGHAGWFVTTISPLRDSEGDTRLAVLMSRDITERHEYEAALERSLEAERAAAARLRELDELKSEFVAKIVHDLRTPITVIQGFADTLEQRWSTFGDEERLHFLGHMTAGTRRLMRLVEDIMLVARIDSDGLPLRRDAFDMVELVDEVVGEVALSIGPAAVQVDAPDAAMVDGDAVRMRQVLVNLLANALRYAPRGTAVEVAIRLDDERVEVTVADEGIGIERHLQSRLFERFSQVDDTGHDGSGLGLYICRSIVESHGGRIGVDSSPGSGARFTFHVPIACGAAVGAPA